MRLPAFLNVVRKRRVAGPICRPLSGSRLFAPWFPLRTRHHTTVAGCRPRAQRDYSATRKPAKRFEANSFVEIDAANGRTAILTGGLPFHQRTGPTYLDTLAVVQGETKRNFHLGIGLDLTHPLHEAIGLVLPPIALQNISGPPVPTSTGWFFHATAKNILLTSLEPLYDQGSVCGFRVRLLETEGRRTSCSLSFYRDVGRARKINFQGEQIVDCEMDSGSIKLEVSAYEWAQLEAHWPA